MSDAPMTAPTVEEEGQNRNRATTRPGGCECFQCGCIFIGAEEHTLCGVCVSAPLGEPGGEEDQGSSSPKSEDTHRAPEGPVVGWQPIETAPRDGTWVLAVFAGMHPGTGLPFVPAVVRWGGESVGWTENDYEVEATCWELSHWMPLPAAPDTASPAEQVGTDGEAGSAQNTPAPTEKGDGVFVPRDLAERIAAWADQFSGDACEYPAPDGIHLVIRQEFSRTNLTLGDLRSLRAMIAATQQAVSPAEGVE